ncbi:hypothetical protein MUJ63_02205 [Lachnospiraceae bacterium NSJ-143]|nr:hypothetical protein [Lachnospiraceae bacterium NSJ-143]
MKIYFTDDEIKNELNKVYIEDEDVLLTVEYVEGEGKEFILFGTAVIEGETYHDFETGVELFNAVSPLAASDILSAEWESYDFIC